MDDRKGYTKIPNSFITKLTQAPLNGTEFRVLMFILRRSRCFGRDETGDCSFRYIAKGCGLERRCVVRAVEGLLKKRYIFIAAQGLGSKCSEYRISGDIFDAKVVTKMAKGSDKNDTTVVTKMTPPEVTKMTPKETKGKVKNRKERIKEKDPFFFSNKNSAPACERSLPRPADAESDDWEVE